MVVRRRVEGHTHPRSLGGRWIGIGLKATRALDSGDEVLQGLGLGV